MEIELRLKGTKAMLQHNGRLANPTDRYTRQLKSLTGKRKKTDEDLISIMHVEARGGCWETEDGFLGVPTAALWRCIQDSAKVDKLGTLVQRGLSFTDTTEPLHIGGAMAKCDEFLANPQNIYYTGVKIGRQRVMRARPRVPAGWECTHRMELMSELIDPGTLTPVIQRAGKLYGLGDWRPSFGTFEVEVSYS